MFSTSSGCRTFWAQPLPDQYMCVRDVLEAYGIFQMCLFTNIQDNKWQVVVLRLVVLDFKVTLVSPFLLTLVRQQHTIFELISQLTPPPQINTVNYSILVFFSSGCMQKKKSFPPIMQRAKSIVMVSSPSLTGKCDLHISHCCSFSKHLPISSSEERLREGVNLQHQNSRIFPLAFVPYKLLIILDLKTKKTR